MKKIVLVFAVLVSAAFSGEINEYVSDVYFANGINTSVASGATTRTAIKRMYETHNPTLYKFVNEWKVSVNHTEGIALDMAEAFEQKMNTEWYGVLYTVWSTVKKLFVAIGKEAVKAFAKDEAYDLAGKTLANILLSHDRDLKTQVEAYKQSIKDGHSVLVIAHSQGNLFTVEAFDKFDEWMKPYFHTLAIASPASTVPNNGPHMTFDNDAILGVTGALSSNMENPIRQVFWLDPNAPNTGAVVACPTSYLPKGEAACSVGSAIGLDTLTINAHYIAYYLSNQSARSAIMGSIDSEIDFHRKAPSQWLVKKQLGCPGRCDFRLSLKHITDVGHGNLYWYKSKVVMNEATLPFIPLEKAFSGSRYGKLYKVQGKYVKTDSHYADIREEVNKDGICQVTRNSDHLESVLSEFKGRPYPKPKYPKSGVVGIMLAWDMCYPDVDLDLEVGWSAGYLDVHDDKDSSFEHFVIESQHDIFPSDDPHAIYATDKTDHSKIDPKRIATEDPIDIAVIAYAPGTSKTFKTKITRLDQLDLGHILDIYAKKAYTYPQRFLGGGDNGSASPGDYNGTGGDNTKTEDPCEGDKSCGCIPCEYKIVGFLKMALFGSISGAAVKIYNVDDGSVVYEGQTRKSKDITEAGVIDIPQSIQESFKDDDIYLIEVDGGEDIDRDDDFYPDAVPTQNKGTLHAIVTGEELKHISFKVNILTEIAYQVSKDLLHGDKKILEEHLDDVAQRVLKQKVFTVDGTYDISYDDLLVWLPTMDKEMLKKNYDTHVQPIVEKVYEDKDRLKDCYDFVYEPVTKNAPELKSLFVEVSKDTPSGAVVGNFTIPSEGEGGISHIRLTGEGNESFEVSNEGIVKVVKNANFRKQSFYALKAIAVNDSNHSSLPVDLTISLVYNKGIRDKNASVPYIDRLNIRPIEENSVGGTVVAEFFFKDTNHTIVSYQLQGADKALFDISKDGILSVAYGADIDYEKKKTAQIKISAINSAGNSSYPVRLNLTIINKDDTPAYALFLSKHIQENIAIGSIIGKLKKLSDGEGSITAIDILNKSAPFDIDVNGTIRTTDYIDYESVDEYNLLVIARSTTGDSNTIFVNIYVDDIEIETGKPHIENLSITIPENTKRGTVIGQLSTQEEVDDIRIITHREKERFSVEKNGTIRLSSKAYVDYEQNKEHHFEVIAYNKNGASNIAHVAVFVTNVPDTVPSVTGFTKRFVENKKYFQDEILGQVSVLNRGEGNVTSFTMSPTYNGLFDIDANGTVRLKADTTFDYEERENYSMIVKAENQIGRSERAHIYIKIEDVLDSPPVIIYPKGYSIEENADKGALIGKIEVYALYKEGILDYKIAKDDKQILSIDRNGTLTLTKEGALDYEESKYYPFSVIATNAYGDSKPKSFSLHIVDTGTAPVVISSEDIFVPYDVNLTEGTVLGTLKVDDGDSNIISGTLSGAGGELFSLLPNGNIILNGDLNISEKTEYFLKGKMTNIFGDSSPVDINITFESKPKINAGADIAVYANKPFSLHGTVDTSHRDNIKKIQWRSEQTDKINCTENNVTTCDITGGLLVGEYEAVFTVIYQNGWQQSDSLKITVEADPLDNVLSVIEKPLKGLTQMKLSKDRTKIYAIGGFEGDDILKIIDVSDPENMQIIASYAYREGLVATDIALNRDETKAAITALGRLVVIDISNPAAIGTIASRYSSRDKYAYGVEWYRDNQIIINNWNNHQDHSDAVIADADTMDVNQTIHLRDAWVNHITVAPDKSLLVYPDDSVTKIYDINQRKIVHETDTLFDDAVLDANATHMVYRGSKSVLQWDGSYLNQDYLGLLDISDVSHISKQELKSTLLSPGRRYDVPYDVDAQSIGFFSRGSSYTVIKEFTMQNREEAYVSHALKTKGDIEKIQEDKVNHILYAYASDGLRAIAESKKRSTGKFIYRFGNRTKAVGSNEDFLYQLGGTYSATYGIYDASHRYKPHQISTFVIRKSCYPQCGWRNPTTLEANHAKIIDDQMYIVSSGSPIEHWMIDLSDKEQISPLTLPSIYDHASSVGNDFAMSSDKRYLYAPYTKKNQDKTLQGISVLDTQTQEQNDSVFGEDTHETFENLRIDQEGKYLYGRFKHRLYAFDIQDRMHIHTLMQTERSTIKAFVLSDKNKKIYALSNTAIETYTIATDGTLAHSKSIPLQSEMLQGLSLSPNERKLVIKTGYGLRLYPIDDSGLMDREVFGDINYPESSVRIPHIVWIDDLTLATGGYIITLGE